MKKSFQSYTDLKYYVKTAVPDKNTFNYLIFSQASDLAV